MDLGSLFGAQEAAPAAAPDPKIKTEWDQWFQNPANKAGLLSFGLQAMSGGWGNGTQQLAAALGSGVEGYAGAEKVQLDKDLAERQRSDKLGEAETDRNFRRELNTADNDAAMSRAQLASKDRAASRGAGSSKDQAFWDRMYNKNLSILEARNKKAKDLAFINPDDPNAKTYGDDELDELAAQMADDAMAKRGERIAGKKTSEISGGDTGQQGMPPSGQAPASEAPSETIIKGGTNAYKSSSAPKDPAKNITARIKSDPVAAKNWNDPAKRKMLEDAGYFADAEEAGTRVSGRFNDFIRQPDGTLKAVPKVIKPVK